MHQHNSPLQLVILVDFWGFPFCFVVVVVAKKLRVFVFVCVFLCLGFCMVVTGVIPCNKSICSICS